MVIIAALIFIVMLLGIALATLMAIAPGITLMWNWFVTPAFGVPAPSFGITVGLLVVIAMVFSATTYQPDATDTSIGSVIKRSLTKIAAMWMCVGIGYVVHVGLV
jgi:hypothetical protein